MPDLRRRSLVFNDRVITSDPRFFQGSAVLDGVHVVKFAWSEPPARRIVHEGRVLEALAGARGGLAIPRLVAMTRDPAMLVTRLVPGEPLSWEMASEVSGKRKLRLIEGLAGFLSLLHDQATLAAVQRDGIRLEMPEPQATTSEIRARFGRFVSVPQQVLVDQWCDWVDAVPGGTFHHLDASRRSSRLQHCVGPDERRPTTCGGLRVRRGGRSGVRLPIYPWRRRHCRSLREVVRRYEQLNGRTLDLQRVMACAHQNCPGRRALADRGKCAIARKWRKCRFGQVPIHRSINIANQLSVRGQRSPAGTRPTVREPAEQYRMRILERT